MNDTIILREGELRSHFGQAGIDLKTLVKAVLECSPVDESGKSLRWPASAKLTVRHLVNQHVVSPEWPDLAPTRGIHFMAQVVAERATVISMFLRSTETSQLTMSAAQVEEIFKATVKFIEPNIASLVAPLLRHAPADDGFFASYRGNGPDELEQMLRAQTGCDGAPLKRLADETFESSRLVIWRHAQGRQANAGEKVVDVHGVLYGQDGRQEAFARLRYVKLAPGTLARHLVYILDAYDEAGLELGAALRDACHQGDLDEDELSDGLALLQVQELEVRDDLQGRGLGVLLLKQVMALGMQGLRSQPRRLVMALRPLQFDFPLRGLPADMLVEALDAVSSLQAHLEAQVPQEALKSLHGTKLLYLGVDERATSSQFRQMSMLVDDH